MGVVGVEGIDLVRCIECNKNLYIINGFETEEGRICFKCAKDRLDREDGGE